MVSQNNFCGSHYCTHNNHYYRIQSVELFSGSKCERNILKLVETLNTNTKKVNEPIKKTRLYAIYFSVLGTNQ